MDGEVELGTYSVEQARRRLGVSRPTMYRALRDGTIPAIRVSRAWRIPIAKLERLLSGEAGDARNN